MDIVLAGRAETAFIEAVFGHHKPDKINKHNDCEEKSRYLKGGVDLFQRVISLIILSNNLYAPAGPWEFPNRIRRLLIKLISDVPEFEYFDKQLPSLLGGATSNPDDSHLAEFALASNVFTDDVLKTLRLPPTSLDALIFQEMTQIVSVFGSVPCRACLYLTRLIAQVRTAEARELTLVLPRSDQSLLARLGAFLKAARCPAPFPFPDLCIDEKLHDVQTWGPLPNFEPRDLVDAATMKQTAALRPYLEAIDEPLRAPGYDVPNSLRDALEQAREAIPMVTQIKAVFPVASLHCNPIVTPNTKPRTAVMADWVGLKLYDHSTSVLIIDD